MDKSTINGIIYNYLCTLTEDTSYDADSLQIALSCLQESLAIDPDVASSSDYLKGNSLNDVLKAGVQALSGGNIEQDINGPKKSLNDISQADRDLAEDKKNQGNKLLTSDPAAAYREYSEAIQLNPFNHIYWTNRAVSLFKQEDYDACIDDCKSAIKVNPNYSKSHYRLGLAYIELKKISISN